MARPKEFDRDVALAQAIAVFSQHGYEGTSTPMLLDAMGISRQSLYDTFGDKWRLYLESLQRYASDSVGAQLLTLESTPEPLPAIAALLTQMAEKAGADAVPACLGIGAICEFGRSDADVVALTQASGRLMADALKRRVREAVRDKTLPPDVHPGAAADFVLATLTGIKVAARAGASRQGLLGIVDMAMRSLR